MKIIDPIKIADAMLLSCTVAEDDYLEWDVDAPYTVGQLVMIAAQHRVYEALTDNTGKPPATSKTDWLDRGATNRWRMFDEKVGTVTTAAESFTVVLQPGLINAIALINVDAVSVQVSMTDPTDGLVYDRTFDMQDSSAVFDWYSYFFEPITFRERLIVQDLPLYGSAPITITVSGGAGGTVSVGALVVGRVHEFAEAVHFGATVGIRDYSSKERDQWGNAMIVERGYLDVARWNVLIDRHHLDQLKRLLARLRARPAVYIGSEAEDATVIHGFPRDFGISIDYPTLVDFFIELESL